MDTGSVQYFLRRLGELQSEASTFTSHWQDLSEYFIPGAYRVNKSERNKGDKKTQRVLNDTATHAARTFQSGMMGGLTSPARPWFLIETTDPVLNEVKSVKVWLDEVRNRLLSLFQKSNLYQVLPTLYEEMGVFATGAFEVLEDDQTDMRCYSMQPGTYYLGSSWRGVVDTCYREYPMTVAQLVRQFGEDKCSSRVVQMFRSGKSLESVVDVIHAIEPNPDFDPLKKHSKHKAFRSVYFEKAGNEGKFLRQSGFDDFPIMAGRWSVRGGDTYGTMCPVNMMS